MKLISLSILALYVASSSAGIVRRAVAEQFASGQPFSVASRRGGPITGRTNHELDLQNPDGLGQQGTDAGIVPNLKWSFSLSKARLFPGGWTRTQVIQDLPQSHDIAGAQQHLKRGAVREMHWHKVAEWGFVYTGSVLISAVDENGQYQVEKLGFGDIWYFPKGQAHAIQGLEAENEYLLAFEDGNFDAVDVTFNLGDWILHTPKSVLAKNFGVNESVFNTIPPVDPYISNNSVRNLTAVSGPAGPLQGNASYVYRTLQHTPEPIGGTGGVFHRIDSTNFPISKTLAATSVTLRPGGLRELHWHPSAEEWLYFHAGNASATVFIGNGNARTFDFQAGDTAVFPDNSGHYIENTGTTDLVWIELYKANRVADVSLTQWLALTPSDIVSQVLNLPLGVVQNLKKGKQVLIA